jgi:hypothetical protein
MGTGTHQAFVYSIKETTITRLIPLTTTTPFATPF